MNPSSLTAHPCWRLRTSPLSSAAEAQQYQSRYTPPEPNTPATHPPNQRPHPIARKHSKHGPYPDPTEPAAATPAPPCWLCGRPTGTVIVWHHPVPKSRGGRDVVPMHGVCQQTLTANFTNSELQRHGQDVDALLANPNVRKFVDWVANKDPDFTASFAKKQR